MPLLACKSISDEVGSVSQMRYYSMKKVLLHIIPSQKQAYK